MIDLKQIAQYALAVVRQLDKLAPMERAEVVAVAAQLVQIDVQRELRRQQPGFVEDEA